MPAKTTKKTTTKSTSTRKTPAKRETVKKEKRMEMPEERKTSTSSNTPKKRISRRTVFFILGFLALIGLLYYLRSLFIVATVNGQPISRIEFTKELEQQGGQQALNTMITKSLILQEAKKKNVTVSDEEVTQEISKIENQLKQSGQSLDQALAAQGMTKETFMDRLKIEKLIQKLVGNNATVTDQDIAKYMEENKDSLPETTQASEEAQLKQSIKDQLQQQKLSENAQKLLERLQKEAKINYLVKF